MNIEADMMVTAQYGSQTKQYVLASVRLWSFKQRPDHYTYQVSVYLPSINTYTDNYT